jgi:hypothetical protein
MRVQYIFYRSDYPVGPLIQQPICSISVKVHNKICGELSIPQLIKWESKPFPDGEMTIEEYKAVGPNSSQCG